MPQTHSFIICGFGSLGQYCVDALRQFSTGDAELTYRIIELSPPTEWVIEGKTAIVPHLQICDCRDPEVLNQAGIAECQAALFVTSDERVNLQAALAARSLNPELRLVIRSSKDNLNRLLEAELGNIVVLNPSELPAPAFVNAVVQSDILSTFEINSHTFHISQHEIGDDDRFKPGTLVTQSETKRTRVVAWHPVKEQIVPPPDLPTKVFFQWGTESKLSPGDILLRIEEGRVPEQDKKSARGKSRRKLRKTLRERFRAWLAFPRIQPVIGTGVGIGAFLLLLSMVLFKYGMEGTSWLGAFAAACVLLLGGYGDLFAPLEGEATSPGWLQLYGLFVTGISIVFLLGVLGLIADAVVRSRLSFLRRKVPVPTHDHLVIVGFKRLGREVGEILRRMRQPFVVLSLSEDDVFDTLDPTIPLVQESDETAFDSVSLESARGIMLLTEDELFNLELALQVKSYSRDEHDPLEVAVRVFDSGFSRNARQLLPGANILAAYELAGQAFVVSAFGEQILGLFHSGSVGIFIADYEVGKNTYLIDRLVGQVAYGFGVFPVALRRSEESPQEPTEIIFPEDDLRLEAGDHLTVLATINGLRRIELGQFSPAPQWRLTAQPPLTPDFLHTAGTELSRLSGCPLETARAFMDSLPGSIELSMYTHQANRLKQVLDKQLEIELKRL